MEYVEEEKGAVDITKADFLLSVGRGIGSKDEIPEYEELAGLLKAVLSGSRPVIDKMWLPKPRQVGTSGKTVKPKVYLAMAISGAFQHIAGMKDSELHHRDQQGPGGAHLPVRPFRHHGRREQGPGQDEGHTQGMNITEKHVLVVGGGIGGITAALELASCGVKVTLLEEGPSIGGRMIQLDKTFPTLDCSTCTLSPRMVEAALHRNITLLSLARPTALKREGRGFTVTILKKARFVDTTKCSACGTCFDGCPVVMKSEFNMGTGTRKAVYIPFPQAIPNKATIDKRDERPCNAACMDACPVHMNVPGYLKHIGEGRFDDACILIRETNPFPSVCGRVCYAPCERACNRGQIDAPLAIRDLKRFAIDQCDCLEPLLAQRTGKKVAIIGAGPAGLSCAHDLAREGHDVTVYEALPEPGGMLRAIPEYRLPRPALDRDISYILSLGVEIRCGIEIGKGITPEALRRDFDAVFVGTGTLAGMRLGIEGEDLAGVVDGTRFLGGTRDGDAALRDARVAVIGEGALAIDCARTARRLGARVTLSPGAPSMR